MDNKFLRPKIKTPPPPPPRDLLVRAVTVVENRKKHKKKLGKYKFSYKVTKWKFIFQEYY